MFSNPIYTDRRIFVGPDFVPEAGETVYADEAEWQAAKAQTQPNPKDAEGFRRWRRQSAEYRAWRAANVADVMALEFDIDKGDLDSALITWDLMVVAPEMQALLVAKLTEFGFTDVVAKLAS